MTQTETQSDPLPDPDQMANADVIYVRAEQKEDSTWTFDVTVSHPDTGWDDYADGWDVVLPDGSVVLIISGEPFTRLLTHPHVNEQPFTRSQSGIVIPDDVDYVIVRAHDIVDGYGGQEVIVRLDQANGLNFEVERPGLARTSLNRGLTYQQPDGNRYFSGLIDLASTEPVIVPLLDKPIWVVGTLAGESMEWLVAFEDGKMEVVTVTNGGIETTSLSATLSAGMPPSLVPSQSGGILNFQASDLAPFNHPILTKESDLAYINGEGELIMQSKGEIIQVDVNALPDGRILDDENGQLLVLSDPTREYDHAVLGDALEAGSVTLLNNSGEILTKINAPDGQVFEAILPIWVDINEDGQREIILTASNAQQGAQIVVYDQSGNLLARSTPIGTGYRWRNQASVAPFGPNGKIELVNVITPHLLGKVEFLQMVDGRLERVAEISGYTSHLIGTRNLDMFLSADLDADGKVELLLPSQDLTSLGLLQRTNNGAEVITDLPLDGRLSSNLAGISLPDGSLAIAAGTDSGSLYLWLP